MSLIVALEFNKVVTHRYTHRQKASVADQSRKKFIYFHLLYFIQQRNARFGSTNCDRININLNISRTRNFSIDHNVLFWVVLCTDFKSVLCKKFQIVRISRECQREYQIGSSSGNFFLSYVYYRCTDGPTARNMILAFRRLQN